MSQPIMMVSRQIFFRLLAYAPEELQRLAKEDARRAIPALCFTENDIRQKCMEGERWNELSEEDQREAVTALLEMGEYEHAGTAANEAIAEAVGHYFREDRLSDPSGWPNL